MAQNNDTDERLSTVSDKTFVKDDWNFVFRECKKLSAHWHDLGAHLGLDPDDLEHIMKDNRSDSKACLKKALYEWIKQNYPTTKYGLPSWRTLLEAVAEVDKHLFKKLAEKYKATSSESSVSSTTTETEASISSIGKREQQWPSQDPMENPLPKKSVLRTGDTQATADQSTVVSSSLGEQSQVPMSSVPHNMESSGSKTAKSLLKKGASEGNQVQLHLREPRSEVSKHTRKLVRSFPESPSDMLIEERSLAIGSTRTFLQGLSPVDTVESYSQPEYMYRRSSIQLYSPATIDSVESFVQPNRSRSSDVLSNTKSYTEPDCSRSSGQLYVPESFTQPDRSRSSSQLYMPTQVYAESSVNSRSSGQLHMSTNMADSEIKFSLCLDQSRLTVRLRRAKNLPKDFRKDMHCDPFVVLHLEPSREETFKSKVIKGTRDPEFRQTFQFDRMSVESIKLQTLVLRIYNHALNNKTIGKITLPISDIELSGTSMKMKITKPEEMESNYQGDLLLSLEYNPVSHILAGIISRAICLTKCDMFGKSDPYVKVIISHYDARVHKFKTSVKNKTLAPVYNETFSFQISEEMSVDNITLSFFVIDRDLAKRNDIIGVVNIGQRVTSKLGREHWDWVLQSPRKEVSFWHPVQLATSAQKRRMRSRSPSPAPQ